MYLHELFKQEHLLSIHVFLHGSCPVRMRIEQGQIDTTLMAAEFYFKNSTHNYTVKFMNPTF